MSRFNVESKKIIRNYASGRAHREETSDKFKLDKGALNKERVAVKTNATAKIIIENFVQDKNIKEGVFSKRKAPYLCTDISKELVDTNRNKNKIIGNYVLGKTIREGTFSKVKLGTHTLTNEAVAVKILEKRTICDVSNVERVSRELHILKLLRHPNIIHLYEVISIQIIETTNRLFIIMEYVSGGELFDYIVRHSRLSETESCTIFHQIVSGVGYLQKLNIAHRNLTLEHLLLDGKNNIKIAGFSLSNTHGPGELLQTVCGSLCYSAPEMIAGHKYMGSRVDLWSCGVVLFSMLSG